MNKQLVKTTGFLYKVKKFFRTLIRIGENDSSSDDLQNNREKKTVPNSMISNSLSKSFELNRRNNVIREKLLLGEIGPSELDEYITEEMIEYFTKDIQEKRREIENRKRHIIELRKELKDG